MVGYRLCLRERGLRTKKRELVVREQMELRLISEFRAHPRHAQAVLFSHDGLELATTGMDALAQVWDATDFTHSRSFEGHEKSVNAIDLSPDGTIAITGSTDRTVMVWDWKTGEAIHRFSGHRNTVAAVAFSPNGEAAASSSYGGRVGIWEVGSDAPEVFRSHPRHVTSLSFSPDGGSLATAGLGNIVKIWDMGSREPLAEIQAPGQAATGCLFLPDGRLCCTTYEGDVAIYEGESYSLVASGAPQGIRVSSARPLRGSDGLICSVEGGIVALDLGAMEVSARYETGIKGMYGVSVSADGGRVAAASADGRCRVWEVVGG